MRTSALVLLYPRRWRDRYGLELEELLGAEPLSLRAFTDLVAGAIDARWNPQQVTRPRTEHEDKKMRLGMMRCTSVPMTRQEQSKAGMWMIGFSLATATVAILLQYTLGKTSVTEALLYGGFPASLMLANDKMYFRRYSPVARRVLAVGGAVAMLLFMWICVVVGKLI